MSRRPAGGPTVATRRGGRTVGAERGDGSASTAARSKSSARGSGAWTADEVTILSWETAAQEDWLGRWAMDLMLINVSTRRFGRAVRLPEGDVPAPPGSGGSKSAASRRLVALSAAPLADLLAGHLFAVDPP